MKKIIYTFENGTRGCLVKLTSIKVTITKNIITIKFGAEDYYITKKITCFKNVILPFEKIKYPNQEDIKIGCLKLDGYNETLRFDDINFIFIDEEAPYLIEFKEKLNNILGFDLKDYCFDVFDILRDDIQKHEDYNFKNLLVFEKKDKIGCF